jgi:hypothetical protein
MAVTKTIEIDGIPVTFPGFSSNPKIIQKSISERYLQGSLSTREKY